MTRITLILLLSFIISSCRQNEKIEVKLNNTIKADSIENENIPEVMQCEFNRSIKAVNESELKTDTSNKTEFRYFLFQPKFRGFNEFYKLNYRDSNLTSVEFTEILPDGSGKDSIYTTKHTRLSYKDLVLFEQLLDKSMFWSLKSIVETKHHFDADIYIYESKRWTSKQHQPWKKQYNFVFCDDPSNFDFINLGQYLRKIAGQKNNYKEIRLK